jgi:hypothetical protein
MTKNISRILTNICSDRLAESRDFYVTFVVPEVDSVYKKALEMGIHIIQEPKNEGSSWIPGR